MIPAFMLMFSCAALGQFFMSYCRSILATYAQVELSATTRELIGIQSPNIAGTQFHRLLGLVRLAPNPGDDKWDLRVVSVYYRAVRLAGFLTKPLGSVARSWVEHQSSLCAYFAAATLDRRIAAVTAR
ncbi:MAG: hypothetical protein WBD87_07965 [Candidatus Acidiferrales bacterium]